MTSNNNLHAFCRQKLSALAVGLCQGSRESQAVEWAETGFGRPFCVCPKGTGNLPIYEHRSHHEDDSLFRRTDRGQSTGTQETVRRSWVHWYVDGSINLAWGDR